MCFGLHLRYSKYLGRTYPWLTTLVAYFLITWQFVTVKSPTQNRYIIFECVVNYFDVQHCGFTAPGDYSSVQFPFWKCYSLEICAIIYLLPSPHHFYPFLWFTKIYLGFFPLYGRQYMTSLSWKRRGSRILWRCL